MIPFFRRKKQDSEQTPSSREEDMVPDAGASATAATVPALGTMTTENEPVTPASGIRVADSKKQASLSWLERLKQGLSKTASPLTDGISRLFNSRKLDAAMLEELEELLILSDMGVNVANQLVAELRKATFEKDISGEDVRQFLAERISHLLQPVAKPLLVEASKKPFVLTVVGVNGVGKTTTIGKIAQQWREQGYSVVIAAADTFRAAAVEQLQVWGERSGCPVITGQEGADPASVAYQAVEKALEDQLDILIIDTAGRLHNKTGLMEELKKIHRVIGKKIMDAPHATLLVLDATTGQNAIQQVKHFADIVPVSGLALTKLDGTAKGGILVALAEQFGLPVHYLGVGESIEDLRSFTATEFAASLLQVSEINRKS